ncbi:carbohydrate binding domain-containing protein [Flagellimonas sp. 389]|uniref:PKD domain-containing protein n=1 Tax=Flagellimonas sp. 389 TaxID=2835862 RepID=UPI001BD5C1D3|nr:PKD domain-containing protein [Flagellimonas sp. 389]MBS9462245.1 carbohydrate binding domain-containing protein [Flagellimonas sp. 389]
MKELLNKAKYLVLFTLAISFFGCDDDDEGTLPEVISSFTFTLDEDAGIVTFINISEEAQTYAWDFGDGTTSSEINPVKTYVSGTYTVKLTASNTAGASDVFEDELTINLPEPPPPFDSGLLTNGDFENGSEGWSGNAANVQTEGGNSFNFANVETAGDAFNVNLSQVLDLTEGTNYILTFDASSDRVRTIIAGIGLNVDPFTNDTRTVDLTTDTQTFTLELSATGFGGADSRVLFDLGAAVGTVVIDNVSLVEGGDGGETAGCSDTLVAATSLPLDFEGCETFLSDANFGSGLTSELVENPFKTGINTSDFVLQVDKAAGADFFAGIQNTFENNFDLTTTNVFKAKIYSTKANVVFRFELALDPQTDPPTGNPAPVFITVPNANEWTEVEVTFTNLPGGPTAYNQLVIKPDNDEMDSAITADGTYYFDDIVLDIATVVATEPTMAAPTPTQNAADVTSVFSNAYTNVAGTNTRAFGNGDGATFSEIQVAGDDVWRYDNTDFVGIQNDAGFDSRTNFSMDIWVAEDVSFRAGLISFTTPTSREDVEVNLTGGEWNTIDVAITDLVPSAGPEGPLPDDPTINQIIFDVLGDGVTANIFVDNVFFYTDNGGGSTGGGCTDTPTDALSLPATFEACETFLGTFTNDGSISVELAANPSATGLNTSANVLRINKAIGTSRFAGVQNAFPNVDVIGDLASTTLKVLVYSDRANVSYRFGVNNNPNAPGIGLPGEVTVVAAAANEWVELEVVFTGIPPNFEANQLVIKPDNPVSIGDGELTTEDGVFYIDNIRID